MRVLFEMKGCKRCSAIYCNIVEKKFKHKGCCLSCKYFLKCNQRNDQKDICYRIKIKRIKEVSNDTK